MALIYVPKGKAREYSPYALNVYSGGCDHQCKYCYCANIMRGSWGDKARPRNINGLENEASKISRQILLCFMSDPYCAADIKHQQTRTALLALGRQSCSVAILTKGGTRCLRDLDLFTYWPDARIKIGATLTFVSSEKLAHWEPGAAKYEDRIAALETVHNAGVKTWASIEPVIEPDESLAAIERSLHCVDAYKIGKWNHAKEAKQIDWADFALRAVNMVRRAGKMLYVKDDLRPFLPDGYLTKQECDCDSLELPARVCV